MTFMFSLAAALISSPRKSRLVEQLPGIDDGQARAYPSRLWNEASTRYWTCSFLPSWTQYSGVQPPFVTSFSHPLQLVCEGDVRIPQCRKRPAVELRRNSCLGCWSSAWAADVGPNQTAPTGMISSAAAAANHLRKRLLTSLSVATQSTEVNG